MQDANHIPTDGYDDDYDIDDEEEAVASFTEEFKINDHLVVRLVQDRVHMYVNGKVFDQCVYPVVDLGDDEYYPDDEPVKVPSKASRTLDAMLWKQHGTLDHPGYDEGLQLSSKDQFWGLCSALQAWAENHYDTRLLHVNLAFPLARALALAGDNEAKLQFEREVVSRWNSDFEPVQNYLAQQGYLNRLSPKTIVEILVHGGPRYLIDGLRQRVNEKALIDAWNEAPGRAQLGILETFRDYVARMDTNFQAKMLVGCASMKVGQSLKCIIDTNKFSTAQIEIAKKNKRASKIFASKIS
nr:hypothetical protein [Candidatus Sigynarchaeota archaeon]